MSLLDKQEVQDICEHTALRARKWSGFMLDKQEVQDICEHTALRARKLRLGGLGITIPSKQADQDHLSSLLVTSDLQDHIISQDEAYGYEVIAKQLESKAIVRNENREKSLKAVRDLTEILPDSLQRSVKLASEKGSSNMAHCPATFRAWLCLTQRSLP